MVTKKGLAILLSQLKRYEKASTKLEQYVTDSEIASDVLWQAFMQGDIQDKIIADLGSGTGILGLGCLVLGAKKVYFVEIDNFAVKIAKQNLKIVEDLAEINGKAIFLNKNIEDFNENVDVVIENPPFGTKQKHIDKKFLEKAFSISKKTYSFHKLTSKRFIDAISKDYGFKVKEILEFSFPLKQTMKFHKKQIKRIKTGCWRLDKFK